MMTDREKLELIEFVVNEKWPDRAAFYEALDHTDKAKAAIPLAQALYEIKEVLKG